MKFEREHNRVGKALICEEEKTCSPLVSRIRLNAVVTLALNTALRKNEIRILRWSQVDFESGRSLLAGRKRKAGAAE